MSVTLLLPLVDDLIELFLCPHPLPKNKSICIIRRYRDVDVTPNFVWKPTQTNSYYKQLLHRVHTFLNCDQKQNIANAITRPKNTSISDFCAVHMVEHINRLCVIHYALIHKDLCTERTCIPYNPNCDLSSAGKFISGGFCDGYLHKRPIFCCPKKYTELYLHWFQTSFLENRKCFPGNDNGNEDFIALDSDDNEDSKDDQAIQDSTSSSKSATNNNTGARSNNDRSAQPLRFPIHFNKMIACLGCKLIPLYAHIFEDHLSELEEMQLSHEFEFNFRYLMHFLVKYRFVALGKKKIKKFNIPKEMLPHSQYYKRLV